MKAPVRIYARRNRRRGIWKKFVSMVACIVVFVTTYALLLPAITMEKTASCGLEEHQHDDSCYEEQLICGLEETEGHWHTDACYTTRLDLICEKTLHSHTKECFDSEGNLLCALEEHAHQTGCYDEDGNFICTLEEHTHTKECFDKDGTLTCALGEHAHNSGCFTVDRLLACGQEETEPHHHTDACYEKVLVCGKEPHTHSAECYVEEEAPYVDNAVADAGKGDFADDNSAGESGAETSTADVVAGEQDSDGSEAADGTPDSQDPAETAEEIYTDTVEADSSEAADGIAEAGDEEAAADSTAEAENGRPESGTEAGSDQSDQASDKSGSENTAENGAEDAAATAGTSADATSTAAASGDSASVSGDAVATAETESQKTVFYQGTAGTLTFDGPDYTVTASYTEDAGIPAGASLVVSEITEEQKVYETYREQAEEAVGSQNAGNSIAAEDASGAEGNSEGNNKPSGHQTSASTVTQVRLFDISIVRNGVKVEPQAPVSVQIAYRETVQDNENTEVSAVHFEGADEIPVLLDTRVEDVEPVKSTSTPGSQVFFETDGFSIFAIVVTTTIEKNVLASDGHNYRITVNYDDDAGIPADADLVVEEITESSFDYDTYVLNTRSVLGIEEGNAGYIRLFDISIVKGGEKVQPAAGHSVAVQIELADSVSNKLNVVHFADGEWEGEKVETTTESTEEGVVVEFQTDGFSVYSIVDAPEPIPGVGWTSITSVEELIERGADGLYIGHSSGYYFTNGITQINSTRTGITKTDNAANPGMTSNAVKYYFELIEGTVDQFRVYCFDDGGEKLYVRQSTNSLSFANEQNATIFTIDPFPNQESTIFRVAGTGGYYWNMQGGNSGKSFAAYNSATDVNAKIIFQYYNSPEKDPYDLDGKSYGIVYSDGKLYCTASMTEGSGDGGLEALDLPILDMLDRTQVLFLAQDSSAAEWTFHSVSGDQYYITTEVDGTDRYLTIDGTSVVLTESPDSVKSLITITPGSGQNAGKYNFTVNGRSLGLSGTGSDRQFDAVSGSESNVWLNLAERTTLTEDDYMIYTAHKVSVSDTVNVADGGQVILYTRSWNKTTLKYDYYAVDHDGSLIRVYESGDVIQWVGDQINSALWNFTEYHYEGTTDPNYYYELQNDYSGKYIAPQIAGGQILSDSTIGITMNGRRYGDNYTNILAWDDPYYEYAGLKVEDGHVISCPMAEADDFFFAVVNPAEIHKLTTVDTVDNDEHGITMKMVNFDDIVTYIDNDNKSKKRESNQTEILGLDTNTEGLISNDLDSEGYPTTVQEKTGKEAKSLGELFRAATSVNHLFIQSTYNENGYFEYDSTQNFAHLNANGTFTVYDQLAGIGTSTSQTRTHGQFMPYNNISADQLSSLTNMTDVLAQTLPDSDPRKGERLYLIRDADADYFFGMEMEASFTQSVSGLDDWGHDLIFEFSGDDDFWLYVDGELVLDLGGVHSASTGTINFRTGEVYLLRKTSDNKVQSTTNTSLREVFEKNYKDRNPSAAQGEVDAYLGEIFEQNENGQYVFKDYTTHEMKMFYMERGAGASNLHMRFNLASVKPGTVVLNKTISGTDKSDYSLAEFPYQIWFTRTEGGEYERLTNTTHDTSVNYSGKMTPLKYAATYTPAGGNIQYKDVFFLKPGQSADIRFPEDTFQYYIVECGINPNIYDEVKVNGIIEEGSGDGIRKDFKIEEDTVAGRPRVTYDNHVNENSLRTLTITKKLFDAEEHPITDDPTEFNFRLFLGTENDESPAPANMHDYHVKDASGNYCRWIAGTGFVSLDKKQWAELTEEEKEAATFTTSPGGSISKIPAEYKVEVRQLVVGSKFKVEEYASEIPAGYSFWKYEREGGSYIVPEGETVNSGTIRDNSDPAIEVCNKRGWGLTVQKEWSDADFMTAHDPIYFAIYVNGELLPDSVREMAGGIVSRYWYYERLENETTFADYAICEVKLTGDHLSVDENGKVTGFDTITPITNRGVLQNLNGTLKNGNTDKFNYTVTYQSGTPGGGNQNVRTDIVRNSRPGLQIQKTDWGGNPLAGAVFTLTYADSGRPVASSDYVSAADGLVTIAYLPNGNYILKETESPAGYSSITDGITITVENGAINIPSAQDGEYIFTENVSDMSILTVKNKPFVFMVRKADKNGLSLAYAHFAIYRQVKTVTGDLIRDDEPYSNYGDLVSNGQGIVADNLQTLPPGTYYLVETDAPENYKRLENPVLFTIGKDGKVTLADDTDEAVTLEMEEESGRIILTILVENSIAAQKVRFKKVDTVNPAGTALSGARFDLYKTTDGERDEPALYTNLISNSEGVLSVSGSTEFELEPGVYHLIETAAPQGYVLKPTAIIVTISADNVTYDDGTSFSISGSGIQMEGDAHILLITNSSGFELPATGGPGTRLFYIAGAALTVLAGALLSMRKRRQIRRL